MFKRKFYVCEKETKEGKKERKGNEAGRKYFFHVKGFVSVVKLIATKLTCIFPRWSLAAAEYTWSPDWLSALFSFVVIGQM